MVVERAETVQLGIVEKARILERGAARQGNSGTAVKYAAIGEWVETEADGAERMRCLQLLEECF